MCQDHTITQNLDFFSVKLGIICTLLSGHHLIEVDETCSLNDDERDCIQKNNICDKKIKLENINEVPIKDDGNIFLIESSPKEVLSSREACALESAARNSELHVVMVRVGTWLDLTDNTTCQIYTRFQHSITMVHIDPQQFAKDTPLEHFFDGNTLGASRHK